MSALEKPVYRFRDFKLEPAERRLSAAGKSIPLTPKVFDTLVLLVERAGHVVSKDELMKLLWPRGYVEESNLTKHIWLIRRALGDGEDDSRFIETVPKVGYRFVAPVTSGLSSAAGIDISQAEALQPVGAPLTPALASASTVARSAAAETPQKAAGMATRLRGHPLLLVLGVIAALLAVAVAWRVATRPTAAALANRPGRTGCVRRVQ